MSLNVPTFNVSVCAMCHCKEHRASVNVWFWCKGDGGWEWLSLDWDPCLLLLSSRSSLLSPFHFSLLHYLSYFLFLPFISFPGFLQQPNFKQKFVALLKRFKVTDEVGTHTRSHICDVIFFYFKKQLCNVYYKLQFVEKAEIGRASCRERV